jgi:predicted KAP-like P-loop ATPase
MDREYSSEIKVLNDLPIHSLEEDKFGRKQLVEMVVKSIENYLHNQDNEECLVYGIYGKWGEGKTSFLNMVDSMLPKNKNLSRVYFNPWHSGSEASMFREFALNFSGDFNDKERESFFRYMSITASSLAAFIPSVGNATDKLLAIFRKLIRKEDISSSALKQELLDKIFKHPEKKYIVFMDDVDRLDREELHTVFRLVRQIADFPNTIYILAMDPDIVAKSIGVFYGEGGKEDGKNFLDKIIQVPIVLPAIQSYLLKNELHERIKSLVIDSLSSTEIKDLIETISPLFQSRRALLRYYNQLSFVIPSLFDEVNLSDLCMLEAIKNVNVKAYEELYHHRHTLLKEITDSDFGLKGDDLERMKDERYNEAIKIILDNVDEQYKFTIKRIIEDLFKTSINNNYWDQFDSKHLCSERYFFRYFTQIVPYYEIPDSELNELSKAVIDWEISQYKKWIDDKSLSFSTGEIETAIEYLIAQIRKMVKVTNLISFIAKSIKAVSVSKLANISGYSISLLI